MKAVKGKIVRSLPLGSVLTVCDNSGAKTIRLFSVKTMKTTKRRMPCAGIGDMINASVVRGRPDIRKQVVQAIVVRQKKSYKRADGTRIKFEDNAAVILKDEKGNPKGTIFKGPIAKEAAERWPGLAKVASVVI